MYDVRLGSGAYVKSLALLATLVCNTVGCSGVIGDIESQDHLRSSPATTGTGASARQGAGAGGGTSTGTGASSSVGGSTGPIDNGSPVATTDVARLTNLQYANTLAALFPGIVIAPATLPAENIVGGFENVAIAQTPSAGLLEGYRSTAVAVAQAATTDLTKVLPCVVKAATDEIPCGTQFIGKFGKLAFRRPLSTDENARMVAFFQAARTAYDFPTAIGMVIQALLQAPQFLYRLEFGSTDGQIAGIAALNSYELASRLSYFLWDSMPDAALMTAADANQLAGAAGVEAQARRLLADPRAHGAVANFHRQWLRLSKLDNMVKDAATFPQWNASVNQAMIDSTKQFIEYAFWQQSTVTAFFTDNHVYVNDALAPIYGLPAPGSTTLKLVVADPAQRAGILTQAGLMAGFAHEVFDSPVLRGVFVLDRLLCAAPPPPPANVNLTLPAAVTGPLTTRQMFASTHEQGDCASCHHQIDGIGFGFESYNAIGAWRTTDNGLPVDHTGWLSGTADLDGTYDGAVDLAHKMAASQGVQRCVASKWLGYALGLEQVPAGALDPVAETFIAGGANMKELLVELVKSDTFRLRPALPL